MAALRYLVPAFAVAGRAAAQSCSVAATTTIQNQGDASALAACSTFSGSIAIATGTTDSIALDGIQTITGDLYADNVTQMTSLSGSSLAQIGQSFTLTSLTILANLNFPRLEFVNQIDWEALPALQGLSFSTGIQQASSVSIQNTQLNTLDGINLQTVDTMIITNNNYLNEINMQLGNVTQALTLEANGRNVSATFPNMEWAYNITFRNVSTVSTPSLASVNGSYGLFANFFNDLAAPNLTTVGGSLSLISNMDMTNLSFPELKTVGGGLDVANNTDLKDINFPALTTVGGALDFYGNFSSVELASVTDVRGAFNLQSTQDITSACNHFQPLSGANNVIKGTYTCKGGESTPGGTGTLSGGTNSGSGSGSSASASASSGANAVYISGATGVMGVVAAIFGML